MQTSSVSHRGGVAFILMPGLVICGILWAASWTPVHQRTSAHSLIVSRESSMPHTQARDSADWRANIKAFAEAHLQHTAWGPAHGKRDYEMTLSLAREEGVTVDEEALYAAAYLHDMGGIPPYAIAGVDHGDRSAQLVDSVLRDAGFPMQKAALVKEIIDHHQYYRPADTLEVAILFRDADILDFLGAIDVARMLSLTTREKFAPDLPHAVEAIRQNMLHMPGLLQSAAAKREGQRRVVEMRLFLDELSAETDSLRTL
jgi:HD superfamily phosphodiesterase